MSNKGEISYCTKDITHYWGQEDDSMEFDCTAAKESGFASFTVMHPSQALSIAMNREQLLHLASSIEQAALSMPKAKIVPSGQRHGFKCKDVYGDPITLDMHPNCYSLRVESAGVQDSVVLDDELMTELFALWQQAKK